jgi:hypothetical protein
MDVLDFETGGEEEQIDAVIVLLSGEKVSMDFETEG